MTDTTLGGLNLGTVPTVVYGVEGGVSKKYNGTGIVNVKDNHGGFGGAKGDGSSDDTNAIQAAINSTSGIVFFPPGTYRVTSRLFSNNNSGVKLIGSGKKATILTGNVQGFLIDQNVNSGVLSQDPNFVGTTGGFSVLEGMTVKNNAFSPGASCTQGTVSGTTFTVGGTVTGTFLPGFTIYNTSTGVVYGTLRSGGPTTWTLDFDHGAGSVTNVDISAQGFDQRVGAVRWNCNEGGMIRECVLSGWTGLSAAAGPFNTVIENVDFQTISQGRGTVAGFIGNATMVSCTALGWWVGFAFMNGDISVSGCRTESDDTGLILGMNPYGQPDQVSSIDVSGHTTERCTTALNTIPGGAFNFNLSSCAFATTSGVAPGYPVSAISGNGTTVTVDINPSSALVSLDLLGWGSGSTRKIIIENSTGPYTTGIVTATRVSKTRFTYPSSVTGSPGAFAFWSFQSQIGLSLINSGLCTISGVVTPGPYGVAGIELYNGGFTSASEITFISCSGGQAGWAMPPSAIKASFRYINCDQPTGSANDSRGVTAGMSFADLPNGTFINPAEGMEFDIIDCNTSTFLATAAGGGSGSTAHRRVRYNAAASVWQVVG